MRTDELGKGMVHSGNTAPDSQSLSPLPAISQYRLQRETIYKPKPLKTYEDIRTDIGALEKETEWLLNKIIQ